MRILYYILLFSYVIAQDTTHVIFGVSTLFPIDTQIPSVTWLIPNSGESYENGQLINVEWTSSDSLFGETPISLSIETIIGGDFTPLISNIPNISPSSIQLPNVNTLYSRIKIIVADYFGNMNSDISDGYFSILDPLIGNGEDDSTIVIFNETPNIIIDTKMPTVDLYSPNGSEVFESGGLIICDWLATDDLFDDTPVSILLSGSISSEFEPLIENVINSSPIEIQLPLISTNLARCKIIVSDFYGNTAIDYSDGYFSILDTTDTELNDTTIVTFDISNIITVDSKNPLIDLISPNGGEHFDSEETVEVEWTAFDDSFSGNDIDIAVATEIGGWFIPLVEHIPNIYSYNVQLPDLDMAFMRLKITATDSFGNNNSDYGDDYFILGDPFGDFNVNAAFDFVVLNWGWGTYQLVVITPEALSFLGNGDEVHIVDESGITEEGCPEAPGQGIGSISVANAAYHPLSDSLYTFSCTSSVDLCEIGGPRLPGYVNGNTISFYIFDASADSVYEIIPTVYDFGQGIFGEPCTVVNAFDFNYGRDTDSSDLFVYENRTDPDFTYQISRNGETLLSDYNFDYYIDSDIEAGSEYCYIIDLIGGDGEVILTSEETCILFDTPNIIPGDITQDQVVNVLDIVMIVDYILNNTTLTETELIASDLNGDSTLDVVDIVILVEMILNQ